MTVFLQATADAYLAPVLVAVAIAIVGQAVAMWVNVSVLRRDVKELLELHPRSTNPGKRIHDPHQFCPNPECLLKREE